MYVLYLNKKTGDYFYKYESNIWWFTALDWSNNIKRIGVWGREDFVKIWKDFYNKVINRMELREKLDAITK